MNDAENESLFIFQLKIMNTKKTITTSSSSKGLEDLSVSVNENLNESVFGNYKKDDEASAALRRGVNLVNRAVAPTYGPTGKDALIGAFEWPYTIATNDGATIAQQVKSDDPYEQMGVRLIQEAIGRANNESGDGSTTTCITTAALLTEGQKHSHIHNLGREINKHLPKLLSAVDEMTEQIDIKDAKRIATISAQNEEMGSLVGEIYEQIGADGIIDWDTSGTESTYFTVKDGVELRGCGFAHRSFINANAEGFVDNPFKGDRIVLNDPAILMAAEKITSKAQIEPWVSAMAREGKNEFVLFCDEIDPMVMAQIELLGMGIPMPGQQARATFKIFIIKAPTLWKDWIYDDFALMTGATVLSVGQAATFKTNTANLGYMGSCEKLIIKKNSTYVIGTKNLDEHIADLKEKAKDQKILEKRIEWLNSKTAVVKLGAGSELELSHKRLKLEDARAAAKMALKGGVVPGAGISLKKAAESLGDSEVEILIKNALNAPYEQIKANGVKDPEKAVAQGNIQDPALIIKNTLKAAFSVAGQVLDSTTLMPYQPN